MSKTVRQLNMEKKIRTCLGCGIEIKTVRGIRFCKNCKRRNIRNQYRLPIIRKLITKEKDES